uniref:Myb/SANT-like domain-containing protein n=1 Tax=Brassica oleracea var. oleracea TaxID=109376 RepID=A0A0D3DCH0_BRAOL
MGESHQETQDSSQEREKGSYIQWSPEENKTLINLLLDAVASGLRDSNGTFSKFTVERRIISTLNRMHGCNKTYQHYSNRMKIMKTKYLNAAELLRFSSGFGWDSTTKRFTASKEVWDEYLKVKFEVLLYKRYFYEIQVCYK